VSALLDVRSSWGVRLRNCCVGPEANGKDVVARIPEFGGGDPLVAQQVEIEQSSRVHRPKQNEVEPPMRLAENASRKASTTLDFHLRAEPREKLSRIRPRNLSQAAIRGIKPADVAYDRQPDGKGKVVTPR